MAELPETTRPSAPGGRAAAVQLAIQLALLIGLVLLAHGYTLGMGIFGHDSFVLIEANRIGSWGDLWDLGTGTFTGGQLGLPYYRPVLSLTFALDHALWGLDPGGYQLTQLLAIAGCTLALYALLRELLGARGSWPATLAAAAFALHPSHLEALPVLSRRHEYLGGLFLLLALRVLLVRNRRGLSSPAWLAGLFALLAVGTKETGAIVAPIGLALVWLVDAGPTWRARALHTARACLPILAAIGLYLILRRLAVGQVSTELGGSLFGLAGLGSFAEQVLLPQNPMRESALSLPLMVALILGAIALAGGIAAQRRRTPRQLHPPSLAFAFGLVWFAVAVALTYLARGSFDRPWHQILPSIGVAIALAGGASMPLYAAGAPFGGRGWPGLLLAVPLFLIVLWQASYSSLLNEYSQWDSAIAAYDRFFDGLEKRIAGNASTGVVLVPMIPLRAEAEGPGPRLRTTAILSSHGVISWARMRFPEQTVFPRGPEYRRARRQQGLVFALPLSLPGSYNPSQREWVEPLLDRLGPSSAACESIVERYGEAQAEARWEDARELLISLVAAYDGPRTALYAHLATYYELGSRLELAHRALSAALEGDPDKYQLRQRLEILVRALPAELTPVDGE